MRETKLIQRILDLLKEKRCSVTPQELLANPALTDKVVQCSMEAWQIVDRILGVLAPDADAETKRLRNKGRANIYRTLVLLAEREEILEFYFTRNGGSSIPQPVLGKAVDYSKRYARHQVDVEMIAPELLVRYGMQLLQGPSLTSAWKIVEGASNLSIPALRLHFVYGTRMRTILLDRDGILDGRAPVGLVVGNGPVDSDIEAVAHPHCRFRVEKQHLETWGSAMGVRLSYLFADEPLMRAAHKGPLCEGGPDGFEEFLPVELGHIALIFDQNMRSVTISVLNRSISGTRLVEIAEARKQDVQKYLDMAAGPWGSHIVTSHPWLALWPRFPGSWARKAGLSDEHHHPDFRRLSPAGGETVVLPAFVRIGRWATLITGEMSEEAKMRTNQKKEIKRNLLPFEKIEVQRLMIEKFDTQGQHAHAQSTAKPKHTQKKSKKAA